MNSLMAQHYTVYTQNSQGFDLNNVKFSAVKR